MATSTKTPASPKATRPTSGNGHRARNGNGHRARSGNGNRASSAKLNGNGNGRRVRSAKAGANGRRAARAVAPSEDARRVATEIGSALLVASSLETARHSDDVMVITSALCDELDVRDSDRDDVLAGARLHDLGKASVPREIIEKTGPLDDDEWKLIKTHTIVGEQILASVEELRGIARLVRHSHERWDGGGYPDGLAGDEIPLGSRIIFCADAFHAIRSNRSYRKGRSAVKALAEVRRCAGTQFDPEVVTALERVTRKLRLVKPTRRRGSSSRLSALLLCLALGGGGSAVAESNLLGTPDPAPRQGAAVAGTPVLACQSLYCHQLGVPNPGEHGLGGPVFTGASALLAGPGSLGSLSGRDGRRGSQDATAPGGDAGPGTGSDPASSTGLPARPGDASGAPISTTQARPQIDRGSTQIPSVGGTVNNVVGNVNGTANDVVGNVNGTANDVVGNVNGTVNDVVGTVNGTVDNIIGGVTGKRPLRK